MSLELIVVGIVLAAVSGLPGLLLGRASDRGQWLATALMAASGLAGLAGAGMALFDRAVRVLPLPWPSAGGSLLGADTLSAFFLAPVFLLGALGAVYSLGYWPQRRRRRSGRKLSLFWGFLVAGMALLLVARHALAFLLGWETMALAAFFLVSLEDHRSECRRAGLIYLIATHVGTLALFGMFALWRWATGSYALEPAAGLPLGVMNALFLLALAGFGMKAGVMPLHFWLPGAHANAPSPVSAMLSGVMLKMGIYGLVRMLFLMPQPPAFWGGSLLLLGCASGLLGVAFAIGQHDLKRLLAYHSVENIGIILIGLGLALLGRSSNQPAWVALGLAGGLLHVWNHGLFKALLFFGAGSVVRATGTREIDRLGGLAKAMPATAAMFLVGAVAICGLPPLNGFVSEWFVYLGLLRSGIGPQHGSAAIVAAPVLAMIGALAVACFVKVVGAVFLGLPRSSATAFARESPWPMLAPMAVLAAACAVIGLAPVLVSPVLERVSEPWLPAGQAGLAVGSLAPVQTISLLTAALLAMIGLVGLGVRARGRARAGVGTWDCGYAQPTSRMQYTAASFAQMIVTLFAWILRPRTHRPHLGGPFPQAAALKSHVDDAVLDRMLTPAVDRVVERFGWFRRFQQGLTQHYILYILITVIAMLCTLVPVKDLLAVFTAR